MKTFSTLIGKDLQLSKQFLETGETVAIPTETVYGLAANALNADAVLKIFSIKNRPHFDPLIVHVHHATEIDKYVLKIPHRAKDLIKAFMPGPFTLLLPKKSNVPDIVTSGLANVAIRIPAHPLALNLLKELPFPLAAPSANPFGYISPTTAQHVYDQLHGKLPYILDGGPASVGVESTIIGFEDEEVIVYRLGGIPVEEIENVIETKVQLRLNTSSNPAAPGSLKSHYAPKKSLRVATLENLNTEQIAPHTTIIAFDKYAAGVDRAHQILLSEKGDLEEAAKNLFAAMRQADANDATQIIAVVFPDEGLGRAINDRLKRAAEKQVAY